MNERRYRAVLDDITATIEDYGEETVVAAFRTVLDRFDYEVVKRDPGPDERDDIASGEVWPEREGLSDADSALLSDALGLPIVKGRIINMTGRWQ